MSDLVKDNNPILHKVTQLVEDSQFENDSVALAPIATLLIKNMQEHGGIGISACQLGIDMAMFAMETQDIIRVCINPEIIAAPNSFESVSEGCLSYPGLSLMITRPTEVMVKYKNLEGQEVKEHLIGIDARVYLHEYDHTQGICFTDRISRLSLDIARRKLAKATKRGNK